LEASVPVSVVVPAVWLYTAPVSERVAPLLTITLAEFATEALVANVPD
jgi:hypothetical protein